MSILVCGRHRLDFSKRTYIMGILNVTPDSFSDGGKFFDKNRAVEHGIKMADEGADVIDVGGESTRPGSRQVSAEEELRRVIPAIRILRKKIDKPISIDTRKSVVAREALKEGASIINDISGLLEDKDMADVVAKFNAACVIMHIKGRPKTMQKNPVYKSLFGEIIERLKKSIKIAKEAGIKENKIIIDPGIGFGKTTEHNLQIIRNLRKIKTLGYPVLIGPSRKSFIGNVLNKPKANGRIFGSAAAVAISILNGADIIRVHDVAIMRQVAQMADAFKRA